MCILDIDLLELAITTWKGNNTGKLVSTSYLFLTCLFLSHSAAPIRDDLSQTKCKHKKTHNLANFHSETTNEHLLVCRKIFVLLKLRCVVIIAPDNNQAREQLLVRLEAIIRKMTHWLGLNNNTPLLWARRWQVIEKELNIWPNCRVCVRMHKKLWITLILQKKLSEDIFLILCL